MKSIFSCTCTLTGQTEISDPEGHPTLSNHQLRNRRFPRAPEGIQVGAAVKQCCGVAIIHPIRDETTRVQKVPYWMFAMQTEKSESEQHHVIRIFYTANSAFPQCDEKIPCGACLKHTVSCSLQSTAIGPQSTQKALGGDRPKVKYYSALHIFPFLTLVAATNYPGLTSKKLLKSTM